MTTVTYPSGSLFTYGYDSMGRPNTLTGRRWYQYQTQSLVTGAQYNAAGQLTQVNHEHELYNWGTETRQYNANGQFTRLSGMVIDIEYRYTAGQNNGRIAQSKDWVSGEEVSYRYDSLNRLIGAMTTGPQWGNSYTYDGWGNLTAKTVTKGSARRGRTPWTRGRTGWWGWLTTRWGTRALPTMRTTVGTGWRRW